jgi:predicted ATP-dependent protease
MNISKRDLLRIIREEAAKSTEKYDDDSALKGDQDELPDELQKGIIDKAVEDREKKDESTIRFTRRQLLKILREEMELAQKEEPLALDAGGLAGVIADIVGDLDTEEEPLKMGDGGRSRMAKQQLQQIASTAQSLHDQLSDDDEIPEWTQSNIAVAEDNIDAISDHLGYKMDAQE